MADVTKDIVLEVSLKDSTSAGTQSAKQRLREMQKELIAMAEAGQQGTDAFKRLEQQAGSLKDEIADVNQRVKNLASDTKRIDAFVGAVQGIAAGFQIAQGAAALFGDENEDLQKAMLKVQGAMALANGVQQVANLLQKESAVMMGINTAATNLYALAVGTATGAMRAFRIALLATGIGAAIAAIGLLIAKWDDLTAAVRRFLNLPDPKQRAMEEGLALARQETQLENYRDAYEKHTNDLIEADKKRKETQKELFELQEKYRNDLVLLNAEGLQKELIAIDQKYAAHLAKLKKYGKDTANLEAIIAKEKEAKRQEFLDKEFDIIFAGLQREADAEKAYLDGRQTEFDKFFEEYFAAGQAQVDADKKFAEQRKAIEKSVADYKQQVITDSVTAIGQILSAFGNENKGLALAALAIEKGSAIANVIINLQKEMSANAALAMANPANIVTGGAAGIAQTKALNTLAKVRAGLRIAAITAAGIQAGKSIMGGGDSVGGGGGGGMMPTGAGGGATNAPAVFGNPNVTDLSGFGGGQGQQNQPMRAYVVERDIQQTTSRVRRLSEFATLG